MEMRLGSLALIRTSKYNLVFPPRNLLHTLMSQEISAHLSISFKYGSNNGLNQSIYVIVKIIIFTKLSKRTICIPSCIKITCISGFEYLHSGNIIVCVNTPETTGDFIIKFVQKRTRFQFLCGYIRFNISRCQSARNGILFCIFSRYAARSFTFSFALRRIP